MKAPFEVTGHYALSWRGGFVLGQIRGGGFRPGMRVVAGDNSSTLTISGVEHLCNPAERRYMQALIFREKPGLESVLRWFPVGTVIEGIDADSD